MLTEIDGFIHYLENVKEASKNTVLSYRRDLEQMAEYMEMDHQIAVMERLRRKERRKEGRRQGIRKNLIYKAACMFGLA